MKLKQKQIVQKDEKATFGEYSNYFLEYVGYKCEKSLKSCFSDADAR